MATETPKNNNLVPAAQNGKGHQDDIAPANWKSTTYIVGGVIGLVTGLLSAFLYSRAAEENSPNEKPGRIQTGDIFKLGLAAIGLVRLITDLGAKKPDNRN